ncbi:MAG TPA: hypothetical protein VIP77_15605 [Jiangellaceae bacterium]
MAAHYAAKAALWGHIALHHDDPDMRGRAHREMGDAYRLAYLFYEIAGNAGDRLAAELWQTLNDGEEMAADLEAWLAEYAVPADQIAEIAKQVCEPNPLAGTRAGMGGAA